MEARLLSAALLMLASKPVNDISVNDLIDHEQVSRGTFYKYFDSLSQVFSQLSAKLEDELAPFADDFIHRIPDGSVRVATGTRLILHFGSRMPIFGKVMLQSGWPTERSAGVFLKKNLDRDIRLAMTQGSFSEMPLSVAFNLIIGPMLGGLQTMLIEDCATDYPEQITLRILLSLGMTRESALRAVAFPIPEMTLPPVGLIGDILKLSAPPP
jgi:AcrR family transcriptional regulator